MRLAALANLGRRFGATGKGFYLKSIRFPEIFANLADEFGDTISLRFVNTNTEYDVFFANTYDERERTPANFISASFRSLFCRTLPNYIAEHAKTTDFIIKFDKRTNFYLIFNI